MPKGLHGLKDFHWLKYHMDVMMSKDTKHARIINIKGMLNIGCTKCLSKQNYALCNIGLKNMS